MKLTKQKVIFSMCCLTAVICFSVFAVPALLNAKDFYSGELTFGTESAYTDFKDALIDSDAEWAKMEILSSSPPIIVHFEISVDQDYNFPYGEKHSIYPWALLLGISCLLAAIVLAAIYPSWEWNTLSLKDVGE